MNPQLSPALDTALATVVNSLLERDGISICLHDDRVEVMAADDRVIFEAHGAFSPWDITRALHLPPGDAIGHINDERTDPVPAASLTVRYYPSAVACCDDRPATDPGGTCPACGRRLSKTLRDAVNECGHGNEIRTFSTLPKSPAWTAAFASASIRPAKTQQSTRVSCRTCRCTADATPLRPPNTASTPRPSRPSALRRLGSPN